MGQNSSNQRDVLIRLYGDSISMPRCTEGVSYLETYFELLNKRLTAAVPEIHFHLYNRSQGGATIDKLYESYLQDSSYFGVKGGEIAILQCGVCDCAPRPTPPWLYSLISRSPRWIKERAIQWFHDHRAWLQRHGFSWQFTRPETFTRLYRSLLEKAAGEFTRVYVINIPPTNEAMERHSPGFSQFIVQYNKIIETLIQQLNLKNVMLVDVFSEVSKSKRDHAELIVRADGHHPTVQGHQLYCDAIWEIESQFWKASAEKGLNVRALRRGTPAKRKKYG